MNRSKKRNLALNEDDFNSRSFAKKARRGSDSDSSPEVTPTKTEKAVISRKRKSTLNYSGLTKTLVTHKNNFYRTGKIISVRLHNFMCHENLHVEFGPNINFLVGSNGSGKSAVLHAVQLGLAANARATNRASSIKKFIKNDETSASIEITLCNSGERPFQPTKYGSRITVVRQIRQSASTYCLKDEQGVVVSKKLADLRTILQYFKITVENPVYILTQDHSKEFLKELNPKTNYQFLIKGTGLDQCFDSLQQCEEERVKFNSELSVIQEMLTELKKDEKSEMEKLKILEFQENVKKRLETANAEIAWLKVTQIESSINSINHQIVTIENKNKELEISSSQNQDAGKQLRDQLQAIELAKNNYKQSYEDLMMKVREAKKRILECQNNAKDRVARRDQIDLLIANQENALQNCQVQMDNYQTEIAKCEQLRKTHENNILILNEKLKANKETVEDLQAQKHEIQITSSTMKDDLTNMKSAICKMENTRSNLRSEIHSLQSNKSDEFAAYGNQAKEIHRLLNAHFKGENANRRPRGPLGRYITVPNPKYRNLIEHQLSSCLRSYIVGTDADRQWLGKELKKMNPNGYIPTIIATAFTSTVYNVSKHRVRPPPNTTLLMDEICCEDPVVMNYIIDAIKVETVLITDSKETAEYLTSEEENVPPNLSRILVANSGSEYIPAPNWAMYSNRIRPARFIQVDVNDRIHQLKMDESKILEKQKHYQLGLNKAQNDLASILKEIHTKTAIIEERNAENHALFSQIMDIQNFEYPEIAQPHMLMQILEETKDKLNELRDRRMTTENELQKVQSDIEEAIANEKREAVAFKEMDDKNKRLEMERDECLINLRKLEKSTSGYSQSIVKSATVLESLKANCENLKVQLDDLRQKALEIGDRVNTNKDESQLQETISQLKAKMHKYRGITFTTEEVLSKLDNLQKELQLQFKYYSLLSTIIKNLRKSHNERLQRANRSLANYFSTLKYHFVQALKLRDFKASLQMDIGLQELEIDVLPPSGNATANSKTLSGGERSYSTVSLLKGLWSTSDHPFFYLDEYDVFTDEVNRNFITNLLIQEGMMFPNRQYVFLTPQDTHVESNPYITVHKLEPPKR